MAHNVNAFRKLGQLKLVRLAIMFNDELLLKYISNAQYKSYCRNKTSIRNYSLIKYSVSPNFLNAAVMGLPLVSGICIMLEINIMFKIAYSGSLE